MAQINIITKQIVGYYVYVNEFCKLRESLKSFRDLHDQIDQIVVPADIHESYDLTRIKNALDKLENPQDKLRVVHVAGTSGKTSTSYFIADILRRGGYKVGLSISPHLEEVNERVQINSVPATENEFCKNLSEFLNSLSRLELKLTYFELFVSFAFWYFEKQKVDIAVFEVGLGGLLDGTNVVNREDKICAITDISLDHTSVLGNSIEEIAAQKSGIIKYHNEVFCIKQDKKILDIIKEMSKDQNAKINIITEKQIDALPNFQKRNFSLAMAVCDHIFKKDLKKPLPQREINSAKAILIPGRMEKIKIGKKLIILDGAHNSQKLHGLVESVETELGDKDLLVVISVGNNKKDQLLGMAQAIEKVTKNIMITSFDDRQDFNRSSIDPEYLEQYFPDSDVEIIYDLETAIKESLERSSDVILITGSLYLIGKAKKILRNLQ